MRKPIFACLLAVVLWVGGCISTMAEGKKSAYPTPSHIKIYRDKYGVPSIVASNTLDAIFGLGYVTGKDAPKDVLGFYKRGRGRYAEIVGKSALTQDAFLQSLGIEERAERAAKELPADLSALLQAYCAGFNRAIQEQKSVLPDWVRPISAVDILSFAQTMNMIFPLQEFQEQLTQGTGSNQFAVAPKKSASGFPILSADPHLDLTGLFTWYEFAIYTPEWKFRGVTFPGAPFGAIGHTDRIGWTITNNNPDLYDMFRISTRPGNSKQYSYHGEWRDFENITLHLKYRENGTLKAQTQVMQRTAWGPMVPFKGMAVRFAIPDPIATLRQGIGMSMAKNVTEFRNNMRHLGLSMWNFVFADVEGHISYQYNGHVPRRDPRFDWNRPVAGSDPRTAWGAPHPIEELPHAEDPASGLLVNCNSAPWLTPMGSEIPEKGWLSYITSYGHTTRYDRLSTLLAAEEHITPDIAKRCATDTEVPYAKRVVEALNSAYNEAEPALRSPVLKEALDVLNKWDKRSDVNSKGLVFYLYWMKRSPEVVQLTHEAIGGGLLTRAKQGILLHWLQISAEEEKRLDKTLSLPWGDFHRLKHADVEVPCAGFGYYYGGEAAVVPNNGLMDARTNRTYCNFGSSFRMVTHLKPGAVESWSIVPFGNVQDPNSTHHTDQMGMYGRCEYKPTHFGLENAKKYSLSTQNLYLKERPTLTSPLLVLGGTLMTMEADRHPLGPSLLLQGGTLIDGTGKPRRRADVRIMGRTIVAIGNLFPQEHEDVWNVAGLVVAPGFIDAHSHADGGLLENPSADTMIRQGVTTAIVGQDGGSPFPLKDWFEGLNNKIALNIASFVGQATLRGKVIGTENRPATPDEIKQMQALATQEMLSGAIGLSTGLEYVPGRYASTEELIACARAVAAHKGIYISHMRNEDNFTFEAFEELIRIAKETPIAAQVSHIKLGSSKVWGKAGQIIERMQALRKQGFDITADVYPYTFWQSTIRVLIATEEFENRALWEQGLKDVGGAGNVRLSACSFRKAWEGKTLAEIAKSEQRDAVSIAQEIVRKTGRGSGEQEGVIVTAMQESDLRAFIKDPFIMFCSDGGLNPTHPRGAGTFPRLLGTYVRQEKVLTLEEAIRKMTSLVANRMGVGSGVLTEGQSADIVVFDPATVMDRATVKNPKATPVGILSVIVNGSPVLVQGQLTGNLPGMPLRRN